MTNPLAKAAVEAGLINQESLDEMRRWRPPIELPEVAPDAPNDPHEAAQRIEQVVQTEELIVTRETDLEVLPQYLRSQKKGILHVEISGETIDEPNRIAEFEATYGRTRTGEYVFAYRGDTMAEEMTNGLSYLQYDEGDVGGRVYFATSRDVYFDESKAFMVCAPVTKTRVPELVETNESTEEVSSG